jgi:chromosome segregation ATPase
LTEQNTQQLQQKDEQLRLQQEDLNAKMQLLRDEITAKDNVIQEKDNEIAQKIALIESINKEKEEKDAQIAQLQQQISALQNENQDLINRIIAATQFISEATNRFRELSDPSAFNQAELDAKFQEIETSIQQISNAIQGNSQQPIQQTQMRLPLNTTILFENSQFLLGELINQIKIKAQQDNRPNNKYSLVLNQLRGAIDESDVVSILEKNNINITSDGKIRGGRKTKKNKKQKGGYTYKTQSKRKTITSSLREVGRGRSRTHKRI